MTCENVMSVFHQLNRTLCWLKFHIEEGDWCEWITTRAGGIHKHPSSLTRESVVILGKPSKCVLVEGTNLELKVTFTTAQYPPIAIYELMKICGFRVQAHYYQLAENVVGTWDDGLDKSYTIKEMTHEWVNEHLPQGLIDEFIPIDIAHGLGLYPEGGGMSSLQ
jgi:hypothetical protein